MVRARGVDNAKIIKVIKTTSVIGSGTEEDPARQIYQYWDLKGNLIGSHDTLHDNDSIVYQLERLHLLSTLY
jgi:hypothetical protein